MLTLQVHSEQVGLERSGTDLPLIISTPLYEHPEKGHMRTYDIKKIDTYLPIIQYMYVVLLKVFFI